MTGNPGVSGAQGQIICILHRDSRRRRDPPIGAPPIFAPAHGQWREGPARPGRESAGGRDRPTRDSPAAAFSPGRRPAGWARAFGSTQIDETDRGGWNASTKIGRPNFARPVTGGSPTPQARIARRTLVSQASILGADADGANGNRWCRGHPDPA